MSSILGDTTILKTLSFKSYVKLQVKRQDKILSCLLLYLLNFGKYENLLANFIFTCFNATQGV